MSPPHASKSQGDKEEDKGSSSGGVGGKLAGKVSKIFKWKKTPTDSKVPAKGKKASSSAKILAPSSLVPREISSMVSKDQVIGGESGQRKTPGKLTSAAKATVVDSQAASSLAAESNVLERQAPLTSVKAIPQSNDGEKIEQASVPESRNALGPKKWDYNNSHPPGKSSGALSKATEFFDRMEPTIWDKAWDLQAADEGNQASFANATSTGKEQQKDSQILRRGGASSPRLLTAADLASLAADKAKFKDEELAAKRQYIDEHPGGGWDHQDYEEVYPERKVVTAHTAVNDRPADAEDAEVSGSNDASSDEEIPAGVPAARRAKATRPSLVGKAKKLEKGKGKAVDEDEEHQSSGSNVDFKHQVIAADDGTGHPTIASGSDAKSELLSGPPGPIEKEVKKIPTGHKAVFGETHHRDNLPAGDPQPSALIIVIRSEKRDPNDPNVVIVRARITHQFTDKVDWNDKESVRKLNKWRGQIFERAFGSKVPRRWKYTNGEMNVLCDILEAHLATPKVGGLMTNVDWKFVTSQYNDHFEGVKQSAGETYAITSCTGNDEEKKPLPSDKLKESRQAPVRSLVGLRNQLHHFKDQRVIDLVKGAKNIKQEVEPMADVEKKEAAAPSKGSSSDTGRKIKKLILKIGDRRVVLVGKRTKSEDHADDQDSPPTKKTKLEGPTSLRDGDGDVLDSHDTDKTDESVTGTDHQDREFPPSSPLCQVPDASSAIHAAQAMVNTKQFFDDNETSNYASTPPTVDQPVTISKNKKRSREVNGNNESDSDDEGSSSPKRAKIDRSLSREPQLPPINAQGRHPLPNSPICTGLYPEPLKSNHKKRSRDDDQVDGSDSQSRQSAKKLKTQTAKGPSLFPESLNQLAWDVVSSSPRPRTAKKTRAKTTKRDVGTSARLPTLGDYFQD